MTYNPIKLVKECHQILHLNNHLEIVSNNFGMYYNDYWNDYTKSLIPLPGIIAWIGVLALFILIISLCCRACCACCRCVNNEKVITRDQGEVRTQVSSVSIVTLTRVFYVFAILTVLSDVSLFFGNDYLTKGVNSATGALDFLSDTFNTLNNDGVQLQSDSEYLQTTAELAAPTCPEVTAIAPYLDDFNDDVNTYLGFVGPIPGYVDNSQEQLTKYGSTSKNQSIWFLFGLTLLLLVNYQVGLCIKSKLFLQINLAFAELCLLVFIAFCAAQMVLVVGLADYCMDPTDNTLQMLEPGSTNYDMASYYATCTGTDPLESSLTSAYTAVNDMQSALVDAEAACPGNEYVANMIAEIPQMMATLYSIGNATSCPPLQAQVNEVVETGLCKDSFIGLFVIWVSQFITVLTLFSVTVVVSIMYQFFGRYWDITEQQARDEVILGVPTYSYFDASQANYTGGSSATTEPAPGSANTGIQSPLMVTTPKYSPPQHNSNYRDNSNFGVNGV